MDGVREKLIRERYYYFEGKLFARKDLNRVKAGKEVGSPDSRGYKRVSVSKKKFLVHRIIFFLHHNWWPKEIDHKDRNKQNNLIENLRPCTKSQNKFNVVKLDKGARLHKSGRWEAYIQLNGKFKSLGYFTSKEQALEERRMYELENLSDFTVYEKEVK